MHHYTHKIEHNGETLTFVRNIRVVAGWATALGVKSYGEFKGKLFGTDAKPGVTDDLAVVADLAEVAITGNGYPASLLQELPDEEAHELVLELIVDGKMKEITEIMKEVKGKPEKKPAKPTRKRKPRARQSATT